MSARRSWRGSGFGSSRTSRTRGSNRPARRARNSWRNSWPRSARRRFRARPRSCTEFSRYFCAIRPATAGSAYVVADGLERFAAPVLRELESLAQARLRNRPARLCSRHHAQRGARCQPDPAVRRRAVRARRTSTPIGLHARRNSRIRLGVPARRRMQLGRGAHTSTRSSSTSRHSLRAPSATSMRFAARPWTRSPRVRPVATDSRQSAVCC